MTNHHPRKPRKQAPRPGAQVRRVGLHRAPFKDLYHFVMLSAWWRFFGLIALLYGLVNSLFAVAYAAMPGSIENARPGSLSDAFFFSVQTMATIGYGKLAPATTAAHVLVTFESLLSIFGIALVTGLTFAKFARPTARVLFSDVAVVARRDGVRSLMFRMANERSNQIIEVHLHAVLSLNDTTAEGEPIRRFSELSLTRPRAATFALTWTGIHPIDTASALYGVGSEELVEREATLIISLTGIDDTSSQTVHAQATYRAEEILFGRRFCDILERDEHGDRVVDYSRFHDTVEADPG